jgi:hypothetical protein
VLDPDVRRATVTGRTHVRRPNFPERTMVPAPRPRSGASHQHRVPDERVTVGHQMRGGEG